MEWTDEQKENILKHYPSIEEYERITAERESKKYLADTDYVVIKIQEYSLLGKEIDNDYTEILQKREEAREVIRKCETTENNSEEVEEG